MDTQRFLNASHFMANIGRTEEGVMRLALNDIKFMEEAIRLLSSIRSEINIDDWC